MSDKVMEKIVSDPLLKAVVEEYRNVKKTLDILIELPSSPILFTTEYYALKKKVQEHLEKLMTEFKARIEEKISEILLEVLSGL